MAAPPNFDTAALAETRFAGQLHHFPTIDSTNTRLLAAAASGASDGTVYIADHQTAGRGRGGHQWHSAAGAMGEPAGLYLSALVRSPLPLARALWIALATGLAAREAIAQTTTLQADIRWPNDLLLATKKCGGILIETAAGASTLRYAVIGVGINLNQLVFPPELAPIATSLRLETQAETSRNALAAHLLQALDRELTALEAGDDTLLQRFTAASTWVRGKRVHVAEAGGYTGVTDGLNAAGFLQVISDDGTRHTVLSGGVREA